MRDPRSEIGGAALRLSRSAFRLLASLLSPLLLLAAPASAQSSVPWLVGCWTTGKVNESWVRRDDGRLLGVGFTVFPDSLHRTETLELVAEHDELEYRARPEGAAGVTVFRASEASADRLVVNNPVHRSPYQIEYRRLGENRLSAYVLDRIGSDGQGDTVFDFTRRPVCPAIAEVGLLRINRGNPVRVSTPTARVKGRLSVVAPDSVALRVDDNVVRVALTDITAVHRQRRSTLRGALVGGGIGGVAFGGFLYWVLGALCDSVDGCRDDQWKGAAIGFGLGAVGGGLVGAGVGSLIPRWERVTP
jgi:hypothetical protein